MNNGWNVSPVMNRRRREREEKAVVNFGLNPSVIILGRSFFPRVGEYQGRSYNSRNCHVNRSRDRGISMGSSAASCFFKFNRNNSSSCQTSNRAHAMFVIKLVTGTGGRTEGRRIHGRIDRFLMVFRNIKYPRRG